MADESKRPVCAVVGVGTGNAEQLARRFAADAYAIALMARRTELTAKLAAELPSAKSYACDVTEAASVEAAFAATRADLGEVDALIYNAGSGVWGHVEEVRRRISSAPGASTPSASFLAPSRRFQPCAVRVRGRSSSSARPPRTGARPARRPSLKARWRSARSPSGWAAIFGLQASMSR